MKRRPLLLSALLALAATPVALGQTSSPAPDEAGNNNPTGVTGEFNGNVTTGCSYDAYTGNAKRIVDDIVVPGSIGAYPLKWSRVMDSRGAMIGKVGTLGLGWRHSYAWNRTWSTGNTVNFPDGRVIDFNEAYGVGEELSGDYLLLTDGGKVKFDQMQGRYPDGSSYPFYRASQIIDPYGQITQLHYQTIGQDSAGNDIYYLDRVTEPGGRYLLINLNAEGYIGSVEAHDAQGNLTQSVIYTYSPPAGHDQFRAITHVDYSDGTTADYTYQDGNTNPSPASGDVRIPLIKTCNDTHYHGPMRQIEYQFVQGDHTLGKLQSENNLATHEAVSKLAFAGTAYPQRTETRGDGLSRTFHYDQYYGTLTSYTDFTAYHYVTYVGHDGNGFVNSVTDARGSGAGDPAHTTSYTHNANGTLAQLLHNSDGSHADYTYPSNTTDPSRNYLVNTKTDELQVTNDGQPHTTTYVRWQPNESSTFNGVIQPVGAIKEIDYPAPPPPSIGPIYETFDYNSSGQVVRHRLKNGNYVHFDYDSLHRLQHQSIPTSNPNPNWSDLHTFFSYTYYPTNYPWSDRVWTKYWPVNNNGYQAYESYQYDTVGGQAVAGRGLVTQITYADGTYKSFGYDPAGNKLWEENENREHTDYTYDDYNRLLKVSPPAPAGPTIYDYLPTFGPPSPYTHTTHAIHQKTDGAGVTTVMTYDENFRVKTVTDANNNKTTNEYDAVGNLWRVHDPRNYGWYTEYGYDGRNRRSYMIDPVGQDRNSNGHTVDWGYDQVSNVTSITHTDRQIETKKYDNNYRLIEDDEPISSGVNKVSTLDYYPSGQLYHLTDDNGQKTWFEYDPSDLKTFMHYPDGTYQQWSYDGPKNVTSRRTLGGKTQSFYYDGRNRQTNMRWDSGVDDWADFGYDKAGRLTSANNGYAAVTRVYDTAGRVTLEKQNVYGLGEKDLANDYDGAGKQTLIGLAGTTYQFNYTYDMVGRFSQIVYAGDDRTKTTSDAWFEYTYDPKDSSGNEIQRLCAMNGVAQKYTRDELNRISDIRVENVASPTYGVSTQAALPTVGGTPLPIGGVTGSVPGGGVTTPQLPALAQLPGLIAALANVIPMQFYTPPIGTVQSEESYGYDTMGRLHTVTRSQDGSDTSSFGYDGTSQLTTANLEWPANLLGTPWNINYQLDHVGNRTSVSGGGPGTGSYTRNSSYMNEYATAPAAIVNGPEHEIQSYGGVTYTYYGDRRLASAVGNGHSYYLYYDALGRCVRRELDGYRTFYTYDGEKPIYEWKADGTVAGWQLYGKGIDEILLRGDFAVQWPSDGSYGHGYFYQQDHEGSVTHIMSFQGTKLESYRYDPFGRPTLGAHVGSLYNNRFKFTGREWVRTPDDSFEFGFYEYRNRAYNPNLGRFMSEDPKGYEAGDYNLYRYCANDPVDRVDPMGLYEIMPGFTDEQKKVLEAAQANDANRAEQAAERIDKALAAGESSKEYKSLKKDFERIMGKGSAIPANMARASQTAKRMVTALRDDGSKGFKMFPEHWGREGKIGNGDIGGTWVHINVDRAFTDKTYRIEWTVSHESSHNAGVGGGVANNGDVAYKWQPNYKTLTTEQRLDNADSIVDLFDHL